MGQKVYDKEFKVQALKHGKEIGLSKAAVELGIPKDTIYGWNRAAKEGRIDLGPGMQTPETAMSSQKRFRSSVRRIRNRQRE